jgi:hypothetical protein
MTLLELDQTYTQVVFGILDTKEDDEFLFDKMLYVERNTDDYYWYMAEGEKKPISKELYQALLNHQNKQHEQSKTNQARS